MTAALSWVNAIDAAAVYDRTDDIAALPRANLQTIPLAELWRHTTAAGHIAEFDLAASTTINLVAVLGHNLASGNSDADVTTWSAYSTGTQTGTSIDTASVDTPPSVAPVNWFQYFASPSAAAEWVTLDLAETGASVLEAGRLWAGSAAAIQATRYSVDYLDAGQARLSKRAVGFEGTPTAYRRVIIEANLAAANTWGETAAFDDDDNLVEQIAGLFSGQPVVLLPEVGFAGAIAADHFLQRTGIYGELVGRPEVGRAIRTDSTVYHRARITIEELRT